MEFLWLSAIDLLLIHDHALSRHSYFTSKTIQTATYVSTVASQLSTRGPFLIVAPLSTIPHWYREFTGWTDLNTIVYHGSAEDRARCRSDEFPFPKDYIDPDNLGFNARYLNKVQKKWRANWMRTWMVEVVITTPEMLVTDDFKELASIEWEILVVDEAHRKTCCAGFNEPVCFECSVMFGNQTYTTC